MPQLHSKTSSDVRGAIFFESNYLMYIYREASIVCSLIGGGRLAAAVGQPFICICTIWLSLPHTQCSKKWKYSSIKNFRSKNQLVSKFFRHSTESFRVHYVWFSWFWSHLKISKKLFWVVARLSQRLKSTLFEIFSHSAGPERPLRLKIFQTTLILAFEANSALSRENETKIGKITHSSIWKKF